jgi:glycosyltransferase involved in cell wall biosynthesis
MVLSKYMKHKVQHIHGIPDERIIVNPGGVDLSRFQPPQERETLKAKVGFPEGRVHLLTIRNLEPRMGIENLLNCIRILKKDHEGIYLILGGEGTESKNLGNKIEELGIADSVTMTGFIPPDLLPGYYGAADFFILPSRYLEGFGLVTPESWLVVLPYWVPQWEEQRKS